MSTCQLTIEIDSSGLHALAAAGQRVAVVKASASSPLAVVWQAIDPVQHNTIGWTDTYQVYMSTTALAAGGCLQVSSTAAAVAGNTYTFSGGAFDDGTPDLSSAEWGIRDNDASFTIGDVAMITAGLYQAAVVNDQQYPNPLDAQSVLFGERAITSASEQLLVFAAGGVGPGSVLDRSWLSAGQLHAYGFVVGPPLALDFSSTVDQTITYVDSTNSFTTS